MLMVRAVEGCNEEVGIDAPRWCRQECGEDGGFVFEVVVEGVRGALGYVMDYGYAVKACGARVGYLQEQGGIIVVSRVKCSKNSIIGEEYLDRAWV